MKYYNRKKDEDTVARAVTAHSSFRRVLLQKSPLLSSFRLSVVCLEHELQTQTV